MARYVNAVDLSDPALQITEVHCEAATVFVDGQLWARGIDPASVILPQSLLSEIAGLWAKRQAAVECAIGDDSPLIDKARMLERDAFSLSRTISGKALGMDTSSAFGNVNLGRG